MPSGSANIANDNTAAPALAGLPSPWALAQAKWEQLREGFPAPPPLERQALNSGTQGTDTMPDAH
jgi:hypothetical protein